MSQLYQEIHYTEEELEALYDEYDNWYVEFSEAIDLMSEEYDAYLNDNRCEAYFNNAAFDIADEA